MIHWTTIPAVSCGCSLQWCHNERDDVSNHRRLDGLFNRLFIRRSKRTSKLRVTGLCEGNLTGNSPHKGPVTRRMFPFDDVIMSSPDPVCDWKIYILVTLTIIVVDKSHTQAYHPCVISFCLLCITFYMGIILGYSPLCISPMLMHFSLLYAGLRAYVITYWPCEMWLWFLMC